MCTAKTPRYVTCMCIKTILKKDVGMRTDISFTLVLHKPADCGAFEMSEIMGYKLYKRNKNVSRHWITCVCLFCLHTPYTYFIWYVFGTAIPTFLF